MAIKERKQITGTEAQIKGYAGHNGVLAYATDTKHLHVLSGTAGTTTKLANMSDIPASVDISGKADKSYVDTELAKKANTSHAHIIANVTNLQTALDAKANDADLQIDLTAIRESITNVSSKVDGIGDHIMPTLDTMNASITQNEVDIALIRRDISYIDAYITETWHSETSWYRVWSDGFIEQGGESGAGNNKTISLHRAMSSPNYVVSISTKSGGSNILGNHITGRTTTTFSVAQAYDGIIWYVAGY